MRRGLVLPHRKVPFALTDFYLSSTRTQCCTKKSISCIFGAVLSHTHDLSMLKTNLHNRTGPTLMEDILRSRNHDAATKQNDVH